MNDRSGGVNFGTENMFKGFNTNRAPGRIAKCREDPKRETSQYNGGDLEKKRRL